MADSSTTPSNPASAKLGSPIHDLSYRPYDGPLQMRSARWWYIAVTRIRYMRSRWWFWLLVALSLLPWFGMALILFLQSLTGNQGPNFLGAPIVGQKYALYFRQTLIWQGFWLFLIALASGSGSIAADNRANALLVYLSKPITKGDYLLGKWMGIFITLFAVTFGPALIFYLYCLMSYTSDGFLKDEPLLILRLLIACLIPAIIHASLLVGFSAWSRTPLYAGVAYAGVYFLSGLTSNILWVALYRGRPDRGLFVQYMNIGGVMGGLQQAVLNVTVHTSSFRGGEFRQLVIPPPNVAGMCALAAGLIVIGVMAARLRIRAVEVVQG